MAETVVSSPTREVHIGSEHAFVLIGERINPTGRKKLSEELAAGDFSRVIKDALSQTQAGAQILDVNCGVPMSDEAALLAEAVRVVQSLVDLPLCIDSSVVPALQAGLSAYQGKALVNSVTGEEERLQAVLPLVAEHGAAVIGISNDETGISYDPDVRFEVAKKIVERAVSYGISRNDVIIDPLAMPVGAVNDAGDTLFKIVRRVREELGVNTVCGASNISFGLPNRQALNAAFVPMAIASGMTCAITNPLDESLRFAIKAADVMMGHDENCGRWLRANRPSKGEPGGRRPRRRRTR
jgi:5-methyltetrahydrofolate--homocysteine methyltransferase